MYVRVDLRILGDRLDYDPRQSFLYVISDTPIVVLRFCLPHIGNKDEKI